MNNIPNSQKWIQCIYVRNMSSHQDDKNKESLVDHREISNETSQTLDNMIIFFLSFDVLHIDLSRFPRPETGLYNSPFMGMKPLELDVHILFGNKDTCTVKPFNLGIISQMVENSHFIHTIHIILNDGIIELRDS